MSCVNPFLLKTDTGIVPCPCGKCHECLKKRVSQWSFRLMQESKISHTAQFITLTYDTKHVPLTNRGFMTLEKRDLQLFFKRLRKKQFGNEKGDIKYYACGEYGSKTMRPHYHIILFNADINLISHAWNLGHVHFGNISQASVGYTLKYINKTKKIPIHKNDDRKKEFSLMSKGLGKSYMSKQMIKWHKNDLENRMYCNIEDGKKISMPRYYKDKIYNKDERLKIATKYREENEIIDSKQHERDWREDQSKLLNKIKEAEMRLNYLTKQRNKL